MNKLHLGCGKRYLPGYLHVDILPYDHVDIITDIRKLSSIESNTVDDIYASHVLEHFGRHEIRDIIGEWHRVIKPGATIHLAVPDFEACVEHYMANRDITKIMGLVCGGQRDEYDFHKVIYDEKSLTGILEDSGFDQVSRYDWRDFLPDDFDDWSRAYLPHMDFTNGRLMSLNLTAVKTHEL